MKKLLFLSLILFSIPFKVLAHGTEEEHAQEAAFNYWGFGLIVALVALVVFLTLFLHVKQKANKISMKNKANREKHKLWISRANTYKWIVFCSMAFTLLFLIMTNFTNKDETKVTFKHIHGLGYTSDGEAVYVPAHDGLRVFKNGEWMAPSAGKKHDYMGFSMFKNGFYSSGHPAPGSDLANPLGIIRSTDIGENIEILDLYKEIDFHGMTVGYETEDIYVFNPSKNLRMHQSGFYYSTDQTRTWNQAELQGLEGQATTLAAHPTKTGIVALGTKQGVYLSNDYGNNFKKLSILDKVTAVSFDYQDNLLVATDKEKLIHLNLSTNEGNELSVPDLAGDVILYVQQNPVNSKEFAFATSEKDIYFSEDGGISWQQSVNDGVALE